MEYYKNLDLEDLSYVNEDGLNCREEWRDIAGYKNMYMVSNLGRVKSLKMNRCKILKQSTSSKKYLSVGLSKNGNAIPFLTQILVSIAFLNHTPCGFKRVVDHKDNNPLNNIFSNLQVITVRENSSKDRKSILSELGVSKTKGSKFRASISFDGIAYNLGAFSSIKEASDVRKKALLLYNSGDDFLKAKKVKSVDLYKGVYRKRNSFYARIFLNGKCVNIGSFKTKEDAYLAREKALIEHNIKYASDNEKH